MVELKKKVTLKTKVAETVTTNTTPETPNNKPSNNGKKLGVVILLIVVAIVAFLFLKPENGENDSLVASNETVVQQNEVSPKQEIEQPASEAASNDNEEVTVTEDNNSNKENTEANNNSNTVEEKPQVTPQLTSQPVTKKESTINDSKDVNLPLSTVEEKARLVIRGGFGNGEERKRKLGSEYSVIQKKVNEMYANGLVY